MVWTVWRLQVRAMERLQWCEGLLVWFYLGLVLIVQDGLPRCVGVEALHLFELLECIWAEVLLVDDAVVADHEGLYTGDAVFGGRGDESEAADHDAFDDVVEFSEWGGGALSFEDFEEVAVIGRFSRVVALCDGAGAFSPIGPSHLPSADCQVRPSC